MRVSLLWIALGLLAGSCRHASQNEPSTHTAAPIAPVAPAADKRNGAGTASAPAAAAAADKSGPPARDRGALRMRFDLARHLERAELFEGEALWVDFGEAGAAKYTLGGWLTRTGDDAELDGRSVLVCPAHVTKLLVPSTHTGSALLSLRARGLAPGPLTVHLNGETVADLELDGSQFETFDIPLPANLLERGENVLQLRVRRSGSARGIPRAGLLLDWMRLTPAAATLPENAQKAAPAAHAETDGAAEPGPPTRQIAGASEAEAPQLTIPAGFSLAYALEMPARARLLARVRADAPARLSVVALRDGAPPKPLGTLELGSAPAALDLDLAALSGEIVRLDLRASGGAAVTLERPAIMTPSPAASRAAASAEPQSAAKPLHNVVLVLVDTLRADKLSPYRGDTRVKTPGLNRFLERAAVMQNARSQENWTKPSVATLLSSLFPWEHNAVTGDAVVPRSVQLLPELLRERGFYTGAFIANGYVSDKFGFKQGWNTYRNYIREGRRTKAQYVAADVLDWLDQRPKDKPFFLYMHTIDPHVPYRPPQHFISMYDGDAYGGVVNFSKTSALLEKIKVGSIKLDRRDKRHLEALYDAEISYHDVHFNAVMQGLEKRGLADDTIVVVTSDHGEEFWDHGSVGHGHSVYDELLHVPLFVRIPGVTDGKPQLQSSVGLVDVMPTILEALGQPLPEELSGRSFLRQLRGQQPAAPRSAVSGFMDAWRTLAVGRIKLMQRNWSGLWLYDVHDDPGETHDLAAQRPLTLRYARGLLGLKLAQRDDRPTGRGRAAPARKKKPHKREKTVIDPETEAQLRALGYVGSSAK